MRIKKPGKRDVHYLPLADIEKINNEFLSEMERVKQRLGYIKDEAVIKTFHEVLLSAYTAAIEIRTRERQVDYDIKMTEIEQCRRVLKPWRRCWLWRLLFRPLTNRAQDIIEERAELDADVIHTAAEKAISNDREKLSADSDKELTKRILQDKLNAAIEKADTSDLNEVLAEPKKGEPHLAEQLPGQLTLDDTLKLFPPEKTRRPRPPRSCRKPGTPEQ